MPGRGLNNSPLSKAEVKEKVKLYFYTPFPLAFMAVYGVKKMIWRARSELNCLEIWNLQFVSLQSYIQYMKLEGSFSFSRS
jgi:hypothetical protein